MPDDATAVRVTVLYTGITQAADLPRGGSTLTMLIDGIPLGVQTLRVEGMRGAEVVAVGESQVVVRAGVVAEATVAVTPLSPTPSPSPTVSPRPSPTVSPTPTPSAPTVASVVPAAGPTGGGVDVVVSGSDFDTSGRLSVTFGGSPATQVSVASSTRLTCKTPSFSPGAVDIVVTNPNGGSALVRGGYTYYRNAWVMTTLAGTGTAAFSGDGGPAVAAEVNQPYDIQVDAGGNVFFVDTSNHRVRRIDASSGLISTYAGNGTAAYSGDNGPATGAGLQSPVGMSLGPTGDLFLMDANRYLRRIAAATQVITREKDLSTWSTRLLGFTVSRAGTFYMAHWYGPAQVFSLDAVGTVLSLTSGLSAARSCALSADERRLFVSNQNGFDISTEGHKVKVLNLADDSLADFAGNGTQGFSGDGGPAALAQLDTPWFVCTDAGGNVYIADRGNSRIRKVDAATGVIDTIAGDGTSVTPATAPNPRGDGGDPLYAQIGPLGGLCAWNGDVFFTEVDSHKVRRLTTAPLLATIAPTGGPAGTAVTLTGANFRPGATILFGGVAATHVVVQGLTQVTCTVPPAPVGMVDIRVSNQGTPVMVKSQAFSVSP